MSGCGCLALCLGSLVILQEALEDLHFSHQIKEELKAGKEPLLEMKTSNGEVERVEVIVRDNQGTVLGFKKGKAGHYQVVFGAGSKERQQEMVNRIRQRYAYRQLKQNLARQGYTIVEEEHTEAQTIRLVARRWR
ncbi:MAG: DUF1257 domain-containing protein [Candidatus Omnitrophica bacterium]|nr:DUF1257 domain-containing protein [Candidatus Omnitrophota bacterium]